MVGSRFCDLVESDFDLIKADLQGQNPLDITDVKSVNNFFQSHNFDWAILFSGYTDVDGAQQQKNDKNGTCWKINVEGVQNIVNATKKFGRKLIFISTDFIFDGQNGPYGEETATKIDDFKISWYGITKIEGENIVRSNLPDSIILRIAYPYRGRFEGKEDIVKKFLKLYMDKKLYPVFTDQIFTPTFIDDLASAIKLLIAKKARGVFHIASPKTVTQFDFAREIIEVFGGDPSVVSKGSIVEFLKNPGATPRPIKGGLKTGKIQALGFTPTSWDRGIEIISEQSKGKLI